MKKFSLYIHIPFCAKKCPYCDFNTYAVKTIPEEQYIEALSSELLFYSTQKEWAKRPIQSIFFGGGTPSLFSAESIAKLIKTSARIFNLDPLAEISLEANPESLGVRKLKSLKEAGINRLSIGAQSFDDGTLKRLGRAHTSKMSIEAFFSAREAGFDNISIDLMYGIPGQTSNHQYQDLLKAISLKPNHISCYGLTIEKGTPFYQDQGRGILKLPDEDILLKMTENVTSLLEKASYRRYEISNFAKGSKVSKHNLAYWNGDDYIGLGAGAHSYHQQEEAFYADESPHFARRWANRASVDQYIEQVRNSGDAVSWSESLSLKDSIFEYFFMGLRKISGVSISGFSDLFGTTIQGAYPSLLQDLQNQDLIEIKQNHICLSKKGLLLADDVIASFSAPSVGENADSGLDLKSMGNST